MSPLEPEYWLERAPAHARVDGTGLLMFGRQVDRHQAQRVDADVLDRVGPAVASPQWAGSVGHWLYDELTRTHAASDWTLVTADGQALVVEIRNAEASIGRLAESPRDGHSRFRHDARNLLNSIAINADLAQLRAEAEGQSSLRETLTRIQSSVSALVTLISDFRDPALISFCAAMPTIQCLLESAGIEDIELQGDRPLAAPEILCLSTVRIFQAFRAFHLTKALRAHEAPPRFVATFERHAVSLSLHREHPWSGDLQCFVPGARRTDATSSDPPLPDPTLAFHALRAGFGSWTSHESAGVVLGMPDVRGTA
jgi:hypothetical protein